MNPNEGLSLGSISQIVMPSDLRKVLCENMAFHLSHYQAEPLQSVQREFHYSNLGNWLCKKRKIFTSITR
jgi:hypothetical protein